MNEGSKPNPPKEKGKNMKHLFSSSLPQNLELFSRQWKWLSHGRVMLCWGKVTFARIFKERQLVSRLQYPVEKNSASTKVIRGDDKLIYWQGLCKISFYSDFSIKKISNTISYEILQYIITNFINWLLLFKSLGLLIIECVHKLKPNHNFMVLLTGNKKGMGKVL